MGDEFRALARAIRRPMRRWWLRVGSWWTIGLFALLCALAWAVWCDWFRMRQTMETGTWQQPSTTAELVLAPAGLCIPVAALLWLLAAMRADALVTSLLADSPSLPSGRERWLRLRVALSQGGIPFATVSLFHVLEGLRVASPTESSLISWHSLSYIPSNVGSALVTLLPMLWVLLFLSVNQIKRSFAVIWYAATIALPWLSVTYFCVALYSIFWPWQGVQLPAFLELGAPMEVKISGMQLALAQVAGLVLFYSVALLLAKQRTRTAVWVGTTYLCFYAVSTLPVKTGVLSMQVIQMLAKQLPSGLMPVYLEYMPSEAAQGKLGSTREAVLQMLSWHTTFSWPSLLAVIPLAVPLAVCTAHYFALRWILLNAKPRGTKTASAG